MTRIILNSFTIGTIFAFGVYHLFLWPRRNKLHLYWALFMLCNIGFIILFNAHEYLYEQSIIFQFAFPIAAAALGLLVMILIARIIFFLCGTRPSLSFKILPASLVLLMIFIFTTKLIFPSDFYYSHIISIVYFLLTTILSVFIFLLIKNIISYKIYKDLRNKIYLLSIVIFSLYFNLLLFAEFIPVLFFIKRQFIAWAVHTVLISSALRIDFVRQHRNLIDLKNTLENKVISRTDEIKKLYSQRSTYFMNFAHELKTPITIIDNYLNRDIKTRGISPNIETASKYINKLIRDINNLFIHEKSRSHTRSETEPLIINLSSLLKKKSEILKNAAGKIINIKAPIIDNIYVRADIDQINCITDNLIQNSIKYCNDGDTIELILHSEDGKIILIVSDTGIGIPEDQLENIFKPYHQISHHKSSRQGMGLGLPIVKNIVTELGGTINASSVVGGGSMFRITLPEYKLKKNDDIYNGDFITPAFENYTQLSAPKDILRGSELKNILIVEDNHSLSGYLGSELTDYNIFFASSGKEALIKIDKIPIPDIIISDIMMDEMDGYDFFFVLAEDNVFKNIPFIFLSARSTESDKIQGLSYGAIDYISKPFSMDELKARIHSILNNKKLLQSLHEKNKYAALGKLLGSISHEIFNPLSAISGPVDIIKRRFEKIRELKNDPEMAVLFNNIHQGIDRIEDIIKVIRSAYSNKVLSKENLSPRSCIDEILKDSFSGKPVHNKIDPELLIPANREALKQIVFNLISNSLDALEDNGKITISSENNGFVRLVFSDNGCGIDRENLTDVFEPFYSRKRNGSSSGLGLFIVKELCRNMGWEISVESVPDKSTKFSIQLVREKE